MLSPDTSVLVLGAKGMLGTDLCVALDGLCRLTAWDIGELDIIDRDAVVKSISELSPEVVINCAAYTDVDGCENHFEEARAVNGKAPGYIAESCAAIGARLIHISTDYVFNGTKEADYAEEDEPDPINAYGRSKLTGESSVVDSGCRFAIIRSQWLYGGAGRNFVDTIIKLAGKQEVIRVVNDQFGRPTWTQDLAASLVQFVQRDGEGKYHLAAGGVCSWFDVALEIVRAMELPVRVEPVSTSEFPRPAPRPLRAVLDCSRIARDHGIVLRDWREALNDYIGVRIE